MNRGSTVQIISFCAFLIRLIDLLRKIRAAVAQSVQRPDTGWTTEGSEIESWWSQECSLLYIIQTGSGALPGSYSMFTGLLSPEEEAGGT
jgi:hypothetical protein